MIFFDTGAQANTPSDWHLPDAFLKMFCPTVHLVKGPVRRMPLAKPTPAEFCAVKFPLAHQQFSTNQPFHAYVQYALNRAVPGAQGVAASHSSEVADADLDANLKAGDRPEADGMVFSHQPPLHRTLDESFVGNESAAQAYVLRTADCLAVAFYAQLPQGIIGSLVHAGWRGFCGGIHINALVQMAMKAARWGITPADFFLRLRVHISPAIFGATYECGPDVQNALLRHVEERMVSQPRWQTFAQVHEICRNVPAAVSVHAQNKVFPDFQALMACELAAVGLEPDNIAMVRENTFGHAFLPSYRHATLNDGNKTARLFTHLVIEPRRV